MSKTKEGLKKFGDALGSVLESMGEELEYKSNLSDLKKMVEELDREISDRRRKAKLSEIQNLVNEMMRGL